MIFHNADEGVINVGVASLAHETVSLIDEYEFIMNSFDNVLSLLFAVALSVIRDKGDNEL